MNPKTKLPVMQKKLAQFLSSEEGKITKKQALSVSTTLLLLGQTLGAEAHETPQEQQAHDGRPARRSTARRTLLPR